MHTAVALESARLSMRAWMGLLLLAVVARGGSLAAMRELASTDPDNYVALAENLYTEGVFGSGDEPTAYRPPLYPLFLAGGLSITAQPSVAVAVINLVLGIATVLLTALLALRMLGSAPAALWAGALVACDPILVHQAALPMTETLAACLAVVALLALDRARQSATLGRWAVAGIALGGAALVRPTFLVWLGLIALLVLYYRRPSRQAAIECGAMVLAAAAVLAPWTLRNANRFSRPIVATTHGGYTLLLGNNPRFYEYLRSAPRGEVFSAAPLAEELAASFAAAGADTEIARDRLCYEQAARAIRDEPAMFLWSAAVRAGRFWQLAPHRTGARSGELFSALQAAMALWYVIIFAAAVIELWRRRAAGQLVDWMGVVLLILGFTAVHLFFWSNMRMRAPLMPALYLLAAPSLLAATGWIARRKPAR